MRSLVPRSLTGRVVAILLVGLAASHASRLVILAIDRGDALVLAAGSQLAERVATIARLVDRMPPNDRNEVLRTLAGRTLWVRAAPDSSLPPMPPVNRHARLLAQLLARDLDLTREARVAYSGRPFADQLQGVVAEADPAGQEAATGQRNASLGNTIRVAVRLSDGSWLNFTAPVVDDVPFWSVRSLLSVAVMVVVLVAFTLVAVRLAVSPVRRLGAAAHRLREDVGAPPLAEDGPVEVREAASAFNRMQRRLRELLAERTRMLASISHDLRTLLTRLRLHVEFMPDGGQKARMLRPLDEMEEMIAGVLAFARGGSGQGPPRRVDLAALLHGIATGFEDAGHEVVVDCPPGVTVTGHLVELRRALTNVIANAIKYGERAGVRMEPGEATARIIVEDEGPGVAEADRERVFDAFHRLEAARGERGVGLGLTITRRILRTHGGDITLENRPEGGLRAILILPAPAA